MVYVVVLVGHTSIDPLAAQPVHTLLSMAISVTFCVCHMRMLLSPLLMSVGLAEIVAIGVGSVTTISIF